MCVCDRGSGEGPSGPELRFSLGVRDGEMKMDYRSCVLVIIMIHVAHHIGITNRVEGLRAPSQIAKNGEGIGFPFTKLEGKSLSIGA